MKVLSVMIDVSRLSEQEIAELQCAMEVQSEDLDADLLISAIRIVDEDETSALPPQ